MSRDIGSSVCARHIIHVSCAWVSDLSSTLRFALFICLSHLLLHLPDLLLPPPCGSCSEKDPLCSSPNEESGPLVNDAPLTGCGPNFFDDNHFSETIEIFLQENPSDTLPSYLHDTEISDYTIGRALLSPLFTQEREDPASRRRANRSPGEGLSSSQLSSVGHVRTVRLVSDEFGSLISNIRENSMSRLRKSANQDSSGTTQKDSR